jgi:arylsulfatase A
MSRILDPLSLAALALVAGCAAAPQSAPAQAARSAAAAPNVVVILADDLGWGDLGAYNPDSRIPTPHLDGLAAQGVRFTDAHSPSAVCTPTRYGLLTGRYCWRTRVKSGVLNGRSKALLEEGRGTLASLFQSAGYRTFGVGKWHLGLGAQQQTDYSQPLVPGPCSAGFDHYFGIPASLDMPPYVWIEDEGVEAQPTAELAGSAHRRQGGGGFYRGGAADPGFEMDQVLPRLAERACAWIEEAATDGAPFFLYMPLTAPHTPWVPTDPFIGSTQVGWYGDFVAQVDAVVGEVAASLERSGVAGETLVVFTSDNGSHWPEADEERWEHMANGPWRGQKADIHEGGHRVPFLVRWPGEAQAGAVVPDLVSLTDLYASFAELLGRTLGEGEAEDSFSQLAAFRGAAAGARPSMVQHSLDGMFAFRSGRWKLIEARGTGGFTAPRRVEREEGAPEGQLYDLQRDPGESINLWGSESEVVARLRAELAAIRAARHSRGGLDPGAAPQ